MLQQVLNALHESYHYDDLKGDFSRAREAVLSWLLKAKNPADQTSALLWKAQVHILQGELTMARACLAECEKAAAGDLNADLMIETLRLLEIYERYNTAPDMSGIGAVQVSVFWRGAEDLKPLNERWEVLRKEADDANVKWQAWYIYGLLCNLRSARSVLDSSRFAPAAFNKAQFIDHSLQQLIQVKNSLVSSGFYPTASYLCLSAADLHFRGMQAEKARQFLEEAVILARNSGDNTAMGHALMVKADHLCAPFSSPVYWNFALVDSSSETSNLAASVEEQEFKVPEERLLKDAASLYREAETLFERSNCMRGLAAVLLRWGYLHFLQDDLGSVEKIVDRAAAIFLKTGDLKAHQLANAHLILVKLHKGESAEAIKRSREIGRWGNESGSFGYAHCLGILINRMGRHQLLRMGRYENALAAYQTAGILFAELQAPINAAQNKADQAVVHQAVGNRQAATTFFEQAIDSYSDVLRSHLPQFPGGPAQASNIQRRLLMLAVSGFQLNLTYSDSDQMDRYAGRLREILAGLPVVNLADSEQIYQMAALLSGENTGFDPLLTEAAENWPLRQMAEQLLAQSAVLSPLYRARKAKESGNDPVFEHYWQTAYDALPNMDPDTRTMYEAILWSEKRDFDKAAEIYRKYMEKGGANSGLSGALSKVMNQAGNLGQAEMKLQEFRSHFQAFSMWVRIKQYAEAFKHLKKLEELEGQDWMLKDPSPWQALCDVGEMYEGLSGGNYLSSNAMKALTAYSKAVDTLESRRSHLSRDELKTAISAGKGAQYLYFLTARLAMRMKNYDLSYRYAQKGKARGLLDLLAGNTLAPSGSSGANKYLRHWREINAKITLLQGLIARERSKSAQDPMQISALSLEIDREVSARQNLESRLMQKSPGFLTAFSSEAPVLNIREVAQKLADDQLLIEYYYLDNDLLIWAIDAKGLSQAQGFEMNITAFDREIEAFRTALEQTADWQPPAESIAEKILMPVSNSIKKAKRLVFSAFGSAHGLPFHALPLEGRPLGLLYPISYIPSGSALQFLSKTRISSQSTLLAVGNPTGDLPSAETEAAYIAALFTSEPLLGEQATEKKIKGKIDKVRLLHFATHGLLSADSPLESAIALAKGEKLSLYELMGVETPSDLAVLSACNTGRGETTGGDDVLGLTRGLLAAGSKNVMVSLWAVDDLSTSLLMGRFYTLVKKGVALSQALHDAQVFLAGLTEKDIDAAIEVISAYLKDETARERMRQQSKRGFDLSDSPVGAPPKGYGHPYFWAPFILVGIN
ncbi:MAG: CHAT domain-containing protein [Lewinellaceae bacterium]|nr:CHAT domain-containing protein [Lewinellaceae bacterium]